MDESYRMCACMMCSCMDGSYLMCSCMYGSYLMCAFMNESYLMCSCMDANNWDLDESAITTKNQLASSESVTVSFVGQGTNVLFFQPEAGDMTTGEGKLILEIDCNDWD